MEEVITGEGAIMGGGVGATTITGEGGGATTTTTMEGGTTVTTITTMAGAGVVGGGDGDHMGMQATIGECPSQIFTTSS